MIYDGQDINLHRFKFSLKKSVFLSLFNLYVYVKCIFSLMINFLFDASNLLLILIQFPRRDFLPRNSFATFSKDKNKF